MNQQSGWRSFRSGSQFGSRSTSTMATNGANSGSYNRYGHYGYAHSNGWGDGNGWSGGGWGGGWGDGFSWDWLSYLPYALNYLNPWLYPPYVYPSYQDAPSPYAIYNTPGTNAPPAYPGPDPNQP